MLRSFSFILLIFMLFTTGVGAFENLVYTWRGFPNDIAEGTKAISDLKAHADQITYLSSQAYHLDEKGLLYGSLNPKMVAISREQHIKLMPLIGNTDFDRAKVNNFLHNKDAQRDAILAIVNLCKAQHFAGVQLDFEGMAIADRDVFTQFYVSLAKALHSQGFEISAALIPMLSDQPPANDYLKGRYEGWSGVYDYKQIGEHSDFVTLMTYDQHGSITTPGPMSGERWNESIIRYALKYIPANKISLGVPLHSGYWYTGKGDTNVFHAVGVTVNYSDAMRLIADNNAQLVWQPEDKIHYAMYLRDFLYEYLFIEDEASYQAKLALVKKYGLRGISNWCLGEEDPSIWKWLPKKSNV